MIPWERVGDPARLVSDHPLDRGVGVATDVDGRVRFLDRLGTDVRRTEVDVLAVVLGGFGRPQRPDGLDALVEQRTTRLRVRSMVAQLLDVPAGAHAEHEPAAGD